MVEVWTIRRHITCASIVWRPIWDMAFNLADRQFARARTRQNENEVNEERFISYIYTHYIRSICMCLLWHVSCYEWWCGAIVLKTPMHWYPSMVSAPDITLPYYDKNKWEEGTDERESDSTSYFLYGFVRNEALCFSHPNHSVDLDLLALPPPLHSTQMSAGRHVCGRARQ